MATKKVPTKLAKAVYRSCLRASQNGRFPEVFGSYGATVYNAQVTRANDHPSLAMPSTAVHVRQRLKSWFQDYGARQEAGISPLEILPQLHQQESVLAPAFNPKCDQTIEKTPLCLLEHDTIGALTGENLQFSLTEQRHIDLIAEVLSSRSKQFLLRQSSSCESATLLEIVSQHISESNGIMVACLAGPRFKVAQNSLSSPCGFSQAAHYEVLKDVPPSDSPENIRTRQYILDMFHIVLPNQDSSLPETLTYFGLPPLEPEAFSFWALRYVLPVDDVASRWRWAHECRNTAERLKFIMEEVESILAEQDRDDQVSSSSG